MDDCRIEIGSMLLTLVDPKKGSEVAYNRWYERDHFYAGCMVGPWLFAGSRWVATRALKDLRISDGRGEVADPVDAGSYVAIYWVHAGKDAEHWEWAGEQVHWLYSNGRGFADSSLPEEGLLLRVATVSVHRAEHRVMGIGLHRGQESAFRSSSIAQPIERGEELGPLTGHRQPFDPLMGLIPVQDRIQRQDAVRIYGLVTKVIVPHDVVKVHRLRDTGPLVQLAGVSP